MDILESLQAMETGTRNLTGVCKDKGAQDLRTSHCLTCTAIRLEFYDSISFKSKRIIFAELKGVLILPAPTP